jgi:rod shape-determining protein MreC
MKAVSSKKPAWILLGAVLFGHSLLMSFQVSHRLDTSVLRGWLLDGLAPLEKLVDRTLHGTGSIWDRYFALIGVYDENQRLHREIDDLQLQLNREREDVLEAERLRKLVDLDESGIDKRVVARVIGRDPTHSHRSLTIDKGRAQGVHTDSAVLTPLGIVGRVVEAGNNYSVVQLILDSQSGVGVLILPDRRLGIIKGNGGNEMDLDYIDDDTEIKVGDEVITSGQDRIYPRGLPVGVVSSVGPRRGLFKTVRIRPRVDFGRLEELLCITEKPKAVIENPMDRPSMVPNP